MECAKSRYVPEPSASTVICLSVAQWQLRGQLVSKEPSLFPSEAIEKASHVRTF